MLSSILEGGEDTLDFEEQFPILFLIVKQSASKQWRANIYVSEGKAYLAILLQTTKLIIVNFTRQNLKIFNLHITTVANT